MKCDIPALVTYLLRGSLVQHGCSRDQADQVRIEPYTFGGVHPVMACVYARDPDGRDREVHRVYDVNDLIDFLKDNTACTWLADTVRKLVP